MIAPRFIRRVGRALLLLMALGPAGAWAADAVDTIARVKGSVVGVGTFERTRAPPFQFRGTGFAVGDGSVVVTNAHVLPATVDPSRGETLAILVASPDGAATTVREVTRLATDYGFQRTSETWLAAWNLKPPKDLEK